MRVAAVQFEPGEDADANADRAEAAVRDAAGRGADLVVLPEIWQVGYFRFDAYGAVAEPLDGPTVTRFADVAADLGVHLHAGSVVEADGEDYYNTSVLLGPDGGRLASYRKYHLFGYESREAALLTPGEEVVSAETDLGHLGLVTCYDLRFPEQFRELADRGVELCLVTSAWPAERGEHWDLLTRTRAVENQWVVVAANLAGTVAGTSLAGRSRVVDPWGAVRADAGLGDRTVLAEVDADEVQRARATFPAFRDRR